MTVKEEMISLLPPGLPWGELLHCFDCVESTNTLAKSMAAQGALRGTVLLARRQTGGRGRMGRSFHSPADAGVYMSIILRPCCAPGQLMHLTCAAAVAMYDAIREAAGVETQIKWINDLVCGKRKVAGILTELALQPDAHKAAYAVVGVGVNCRQKLSDFPEDLQSVAGSLSMAAGKDIDPAVLAAAMIRHLLQMDRQLLSGKQKTMDRYRRLCMTLGNQVSLLRGDTVSHAMAVDVDDDGALVVRFPDGRTESVSCGEASVRGMYGYV